MFLDRMKHNAEKFFVQDETNNKQTPHYFRNLLVLFLGTARGLQHVHNCGVSHRDIKPANVLLDVSDEGVVTAVKLADFSVSKINTTQQTCGVGTFHYMVLAI